MTRPWEEVLPSSAQVCCIAHLPDMGHQQCFSNTGATRLSPLWFSIGLGGILDRVLHHQKKLPIELACCLVDFCIFANFEKGRRLVILDANAILFVFVSNERQRNVLAGTYVVFGHLYRYQWVSQYEPDDLPVFPDHRERTTVVKRKKDHQTLISLHALNRGLRFARLPCQGGNCRLIESPESFLKAFDKAFKIDVGIDRDANDLSLGFRCFHFELL